MSFYIAVDYDGTMVDHMFPEIGKDVPGAVRWVKEFQKLGAKIILWTVRSDMNLYTPDLSSDTKSFMEFDKPFVTQAVQYMEDKGIALHGVNENPDQYTFSTSNKAYANIYIDDAAFGCPLIMIPGFSRLCVDWAKVGPEVCKIINGGD